MRMVNKSEQKTVNIGDLVQWASDGVDQFDTPRCVRATQMQDQQEWAFVEGSKTGMPVSELTVVTSASAVMEKALSDSVASPLMSEIWKRSAASLSAEHAARTADSSLPTGAGPGRQTRHFTAGIRVAPAKYTSRTSSFTCVLACALACHGEIRSGRTQRLRDLGTAGTTGVPGDATWLAGRHSGASDCRGDQTLRGIERTGPDRKARPRTIGAAEAGTELGPVDSHRSHKAIQSPTASPRPLRSCGQSLEISEQVARRWPTTYANTKITDH